MKKVIIVGAAVALMFVFIFIPEMPCIPYMPFEGCGPPW